MNSKTFGKFSTVVGAVAGLAVAPVLTIAQAASAADSSVSGSWGAGCNSIVVNSAGYDSSWKVQVRWYASASASTPEVDGSEFAPINSSWSKTVDPNKVRGFSYRIADANGNWMTPLQESAASCNMVLTPWVIGAKKTCNTASISAGNVGTYFQGVVRFKNASGSYLDGGVAGAQPNVSSPGSGTSYAGTFSSTVTLPTGGILTPEVGYWYNAKWYPKSSGSVMDFTSSCAAPQEQTQPVSVQIDWKAGSGFNSDDLVLNPGQGSVYRNGARLSFDSATGNYTIALDKNMGWEIKVISPSQMILCGSNYGKECAQSYTFKVPGTTKNYVPVTTDATAKTMSLSAGWTTASSSAYVGRSALVTTRSGATATASVASGKTLDVLGSKSIKGANMEVYVDGARKKVVSTYAARTANKALLASVKVPADGKNHSVKLRSVVSGKRTTLVVDSLTRR